MIKNRILKVIFGFMLFLGFGGAYKALPNTAQQISSPSIQCENYVFLKNEEGNKICNISLNVNQKDRQLDLSFHNVNFPLPDIAEDEVYFVYAFDHDTGRDIKREYLTKNPDKSFECSFEIPYYCNAVDLKFYKQKRTEPDYNINNENFVGKARYLTTLNSNFMRGPKIKLTTLDKNGNVNDRTKAYFIKSLIPNYYTISIPGIVFRRKLGRIILFDSQEDFLSSKEKTVACNYFRTNLNPGNSSSWTDHGDGFQLYIPKGVTRFKFQVFEGEITDNQDDIKFQYDIDLNRI